MSPIPTVTVDDDTAGFLTFSISTALNGDLAGVGIEAGDIAFAATDILNASAPLGTIGFNTNNIGGGANFNGNPLTPADGFDLFIGFPNQPRLTVDSTPFTFQFSTSLVTLDDLELIGLRFKSTGPNGNGSAKLIGEFEVPSQVPLPAGGWLLLAGLGGLGVLARRRRPS